MLIGSALVGDLLAPLSAPSRLTRRARARPWRKVLGRREAAPNGVIRGGASLKIRWVARFPASGQLPDLTLLEVEKILVVDDKSPWTI
jgi:hypothetical protein